MLCDNSTTVVYVNAMEGTKSPSCNQIAYDIWDWCVNNHTWLTATHKAGVENTEADKESWLFNDRTEWTLKRKIFAQIITHWDTPEIDVFATGLSGCIYNLELIVFSCLSIFLSNSQMPAKDFNRTISDTSLVFIYLARSLPPFRGS